MKNHFIVKNNLFSNYVFDIVIRQYHKVPTCKVFVREFIRFFLQNVCAIARFRAYNAQTWMSWISHVFERVEGIFLFQLRGFFMWMVVHRSQRHFHIKEHIIERGVEKCEITTYNFSALRKTLPPFCSKAKKGTLIPM